MSSKLKNMLDKLKQNKYKNTDYKYEDLINKKLKSMKEKKKESKKEQFTLGKYKVNRKIPSSEELGKIYNNFIKNVKTNPMKSKLFTFHYNIKDIILCNDNQYLHFSLDLQKYKKYLISLTFFLKEKSNVCFLFSNNIENKMFQVKEEINGQILFNTNILNSNYIYTDLYVLFRKKEEYNIHNLFFKLEELKNKLTYTISILKYNNKTQIF